MPPSTSDSANETLSSFTVRAANGKEVSLADYRGQVVLAVNVASRCGFTPQYTELQELYLKYKDKGLVILGFPCNQFGAQEPGSDQEIQEFCSLNFNVTFPVMAKVDVNGAGTAPLFKWLKTSAPGLIGIEAIKWNFTKFLIGRNGKVIHRYAPLTKPAAIAQDIEAALLA